jgi:hypothetical protein
MLGIADGFHVPSNPCSLFWTSRKLMMEAFFVFKVDDLYIEVQSKNETMINYRKYTTERTTEQS